MLPTVEVPEEYAHQLRIGTCSWKYDAWKGLIYGPDRSYHAHDYLSDYANYFDTVEIDQWFWSLFATGAKLPDPGVVRRYAESVPADFRFTVKAPNSITLTHFYAKGAKQRANEPNPHFLNRDLLHRFLEILEPMHNKLGPVIFQFEYLNKKKMPSLAAFLDRLDAFFQQAPTGFQYAIETRNPDYLKAEFAAFLREHGLGRVLLDGYYMPRISEVAGKLDIRTVPFSIIRLHGPDRAGIEERTDGVWNEIVEPKDDELKATADIIRQNVAANVETYVNVNNHYEGCAPLTIQRLLKLLR
ncbi:MAG: DUF72 domain-containing protein [Sedimentisphaerales bacterium]|nr:DUF72 domain-containing protein [Sedimentisphaerales bacterium]